MHQGRGKVMIQRRIFLGITEGFPTFSEVPFKKSFGVFNAKVGREYIF